ncbi:NUDIX hydrolase [Spirosoma aerolatum]|uniref:NUDIX hydrolase n=1 Tax=Spirosoma aerolatum TaxID=1211326 RepID=UPI0014735A1D|nr:NUDIX domain-containing protein [Spirosoma aerolatum]
MDKFIIYAGSISLYNNKILIIQRSANSLYLPSIWSIPCGKVELNETIKEACLRELYEETNLTGNIVRIVSYSKFDNRFLSENHINLQVNFLVHVYDNKVILEDSFDDYMWISPNDYEYSPLDNYNKSIIKSYCLIEKSDIA